MKAHRAMILAAGAATVLLPGVPAVAQVDDGIVLNILRECARIDDPTARLACYDNNIGAAGASPHASMPRSIEPNASNASIPASANAPRGFGAEAVRTQQRFQASDGQVDAIFATVAAISPREPGIYLLTLDGGAQWQFSEGVGTSYRLPREGSTVEIERGALGGFLMRFDKQRPVPVRRIR